MVGPGHLFSSDIPFICLEQQEGVTPWLAEMFLFCFISQLFRLWPCENARVCLVSTCSGPFGMNVPYL